jgi:hypothetical protein
LYSRFFRRARRPAKNARTGLTVTIGVIDTADGVTIIQSDTAGTSCKTGPCRRPQIRQARRTPHDAPSLRHPDFRHNRHCRPVANLRYRQPIRQTPPIRCNRYDH